MVCACMLEFSFNIINVGAKPAAGLRILYNICWCNMRPFSIVVFLDCNVILIL